MGPVLATRREWVADVALMLCAAGFAAVTAGSVTVLDERGPMWRVVDVVAAVVACVGLLGRRRWPVALAVVLLVAGLRTPYLTGPVVVAVFTVAARCSRRATVWVAVVAFAPLPLFLWRFPGLEEERAGRVLTYFVLVAGAVGWGLFRQSRGQLIASLRERAELAEADAVLRAERARQEVRGEIAREMHDVLGHRLSLLAVHAGALEFNTAASREQVVRAAGVIRENAQLALRDLREVIGVLRGGELVAGGAPQPVLADVGRLVVEAREAGGQVALRMPAGELVPPVTVGRVAFRIVQEALTNARVHAAGVPVDVEVAGAAGRGLVVAVSTPGRGAAAAGAGGAAVTVGSAEGGFSSCSLSLSPAAAAAAVSVPAGGGGRGLLGLAERVRLAGGVFAAGPVGAGGFVVRAWLPWPDDAADAADADADAAADAADGGGGGGGGGAAASAGGSGDGWKGAREGVAGD